MEHWGHLWGLSSTWSWQCFLYWEYCGNSCGQISHLKGPCAQVIDSLLVDQNDVQNPWRGILKIIANNNTNSKSTYKIIITLISETFLREIIHKQLLTMCFLIQSSYLVTRYRVFYHVGLFTSNNLQLVWTTALYFDFDKTPNYSKAVNSSSNKDKLRVWNGPFYAIQIKQTTLINYSLTQVAPK